MKLLNIIQKNFKILLRSRSSATITFLGPLMLVVLVGLAFSNTETYGLNIGTYSENYNDFSNSLLDKLTENNFQITKFDSQGKCISGAKQGDSNICIVFPKDMNLENNEVVFHVDYSKVNIVWMVLDSISEKISSKSKEIRESLTSNILEKMIETKSSMDSHKESAEKIKKAESAMQEKATTIQTGLDGMDVSISLTDLKLSDIRDKVEDIESTADYASEDLEELIETVNDSSLPSSEKNDIIGDIESIQGDVNDVLDIVSGNGTGTVIKLVEELEGKLILVQGKLASLATTRGDAEEDLGIIKNLLEDNMKKVDNLKSAISVAISNIADVGSDQTSQIVSPIKTRIQPLTTQKTHFNYLFPTLIVLVIMITAILLSSTLVMNEKKSKSFFRNFITPTKDIIFNLGIFITSFLVILAQLVLFLLIASIFFETNIWSSILTTPLILLLVISIFVFLGMFIGYIFKSPETNVLASISVSAVLLFFSSTVLPLESIPGALRTMANLSPFVLSENLLRQTLFFNFGYGEIWVGLINLLGYVLLLFIATLIAQKLLKSNIRLHLSIKRKKK
ncbi:ABC transporter permease [Nanoarchaeota archaeon]